MRIQAGYDPVYGARPLKRTLQQRDLALLAVQVLASQFDQGETVVVDVQGKDLVFMAWVKSKLAA